MRAVVVQLPRFVRGDGHGVEGMQLGFLPLALRFGDQGQAALQHDIVLFKR